MKRTILTTCRPILLLTITVIFASSLSGKVSGESMVDEGEQSFAHALTPFYGDHDSHLPKDVRVESLEVNTAPNIDVWYSTNQKFGNIGNPQDRINILGNVRDPDGDAVSLSYSLNGDNPQSVTLGFANIRLVEEGDFNIEIYNSELNTGTNHVELTASDGKGETSSVTVNVDYQSGNIWPIPYRTSWANYSQIQDRVHIVDGKWTLESGGIRTQQVGYDRLIAIGHTGWQNYEVTVPFRVFEDRTDATRGGIGVILRWHGHTGSASPATGWTDIGAYGYYSFRNTGTVLRLNGFEEDSLVKPMGFTFNMDYLLKMQVEGGSSGLYRLKIWKSGDPEPSTWDLSKEDDISGRPDKATGSMLLVAHLVDARFGDVTISPLNSNQIYTLSTSVQGSGQIFLDPDKSGYSVGEPVSAHAVADPGWTFIGWGGGASGATNPTQLVMDQNRTLVARFEREPSTTADEMLFLPILTNQ